MNKNQGTLGLSMATVLGLNAVIGAGIFSYPAALSFTAGPAGLLTFCFVVFAVLAIAIAMARMSLIYPAQSIFYDHAALWAGKTGGIITTLFYVAGLMTALALLARIAGSYLAQYASSLSSTAWGIVILLGIIGLSMTGTRATRLWQLILIVLTILPLIVITILCATRASLSNLTPFAPHGLLGTISAIKIVVFGFFGFEAVPALFGLIRDPQKNVPRAMILTVIITGIIYLAFMGSIMLALPQTVFTDPNLTLSPLLLSLFPAQKWLVSCLDWAIIITIIGTLHSMFLAITALVYNAYGKIITTTTSPKSYPVIMLLLGITIILGCVTLTNIGLGFSIVSLCIAGAYTATLVPLVTVKNRNQLAYTKTGYAGILACGLLFICGVLGVIEALI